MIKSWWRGFRPNIYALPIYLLTRVVGATLRLKTVGYEKAMELEGGKIFLVWHGRTFIAALLFRKKRFWTIISHSNDGRLQAKIFNKFGFNLIRGSSGDGGIKALIESIRVLKKRHTMAFTPDGPLGPSHIIKQGVLLMAKKSGAAIIPMGFSAQRRWLVPSWDKYMVPYPFSKGIIIFGDPVWISSKTTSDEEEVIRINLEKTMCSLEEQAEKLMGHINVN